METHFTVFVLSYQRTIFSKIGVVMESGSVNLFFLGKCTLTLWFRPYIVLALVNISVLFRLNLPFAIYLNVFPDHVCFCTDYRSSTDPRRWRVKLGGVQTESETKGFEQVREVKRVFLHPLYREKTQHGVLVQPPDFDVGE